jgi:phosphoglycerate dehydrogenase-like enzyme
MARQARLGVLGAHLMAPARAASAGLVFAMIPADKPVLALLHAAVPGLLVAGSAAELSAEQRAAVVAMVVTHVATSPVGPGSQTELEAALAPGTLPALRWVHTLSAGVDHVDCTSLALRSPAVVLTHNQGISDQSLAEFALLGCLRFAYSEARMVAQRSARDWTGFTTHTLGGAVLGVVGLGSIGCATMRMAVEGFGMTGLGLRNQSAALPAALASLGDRVRMVPAGAAGLAELLAAADYVVLALPETEGTTRLLGAKELAMMRPGAVLVNVGRGTAVDCDALAAALADPAGATLGGAALDVVEVEPLPGAHPLWAVGDDKLLLSPHTADLNGHYWEDCVAAYLENLARLRGGDELDHAVDLAVGY